MKCFKCQGLGHYAYECPNKRSMVLRDGEYISESDVEEEEESEYVEEEETPEGDLLLIYVLIFFGSEFFLHTLDLSLSVMHYDFMKKMLVIIDLNLTKY